MGVGQYGGWGAGVLSLPKDSFIVRQMASHWSLCGFLSGGAFSSPGSLYKQPPCLIFLLSLCHHLNESLFVAWMDGLLVYDLDSFALDQSVVSMGMETRATLFTPVFPAPRGVLGEQRQVRIYFNYFLKMSEPAAKTAFGITHAVTNPFIHPFSHLTNIY